jgi:transposase
VEASAEELVWYFETVLPHLNERQRRVVVGAAASLLGRGGKTKVADAAGMSRNTVIRATSEVEEGVAPTERQRAAGGGDKPAIDKQPGLLSALDELVHPATRGNPMSLARWTSKSTYELADELVRQGYSVSAELVRRLLHQLGYSLQAPSKQKEGTQSPDRDAQFTYLNDTAVGFIKDGQPVVSCDTKN